MLTKVSFSMVEDSPVNVKDYGAVGDGLADDTAAIQAAIAASSNVFFPAGNYLITDTLLIRTGCYWRGEAGSIISKVGVGAAINDTNTGVNDAWTIEELTVQCSTEPVVLDGSLGIGMGRSRRSTLRKVNVQFFATGIKLDQPDPLIGNYFNHLEDVRIYGATNQSEAIAKNVRGIVLSGANANYLENVEIYGYNNRGIELNAVGCQIKACHIELSEETLRIISSASNNNIEIYAEATQGNLGTAEAGSENNNIWMYRDGSGDRFNDLGYNSTVALTSLVDEFVSNRNGGFQYIQGGKSYTLNSSATPIFKIVLPEFGQISVEINAIARVPGINNYLENSNYVMSYITSAATVTQLNQTNAGGGAVFTTSVSGREVTFSSVNSSIATADPLVRYALTIKGTGLKSSPGFTWEKTDFVLL